MIACAYRHSIIPNYRIYGVGAASARGDRVHSAALTAAAGSGSSARRSRPRPRPATPRRSPSRSARGCGRARLSPKPSSVSRLQRAGMGPPRAERADVEALRAQRHGECRVVELGIVGQGHDRRAMVRLQPLERFVRPFRWSARHRESAPRWQRICRGSMTVTA